MYQHKLVNVLQKANISQELLVITKGRYILRLEFWAGKLYGLYGRYCVQAGIEVLSVTDPAT